MDHGLSQLKGYNTAIRASKLDKSITKEVQQAHSLVEDYENELLEIK